MLEQTLAAMAAERGSGRDLAVGRGASILAEGLPARNRGPAAGPLTRKAGTVRARCGD